MKKKFRFEEVKDGRGRRLEGLWLRNDRFYCQIQLPGKTCKRVPLETEDKEPCLNLKEAQAAAFRLRELRNKGRVAAPG